MMEKLKQNELRTVVKDPFHLIEVCQRLVSFCTFKTLKKLRRVSSTFNKLVIPLMYKNYYLSLPILNDYDDEDEDDEEEAENAEENEKGVESKNSDTFLSTRLFKNVKINLENYEEAYGGHSGLFETIPVRRRLIEKLFVTGRGASEDWQVELACWMSSLPNLKSLHLPTLEDDGILPEPDDFWPQMMDVFRRLDYLEVEDMDRDMLQFYLSEPVPTCPQAVKNLTLLTTLYADSDTMAAFYGGGYTWNVRDVMVTIKPSTPIRLVRNFLNSFVHPSNHLKYVTLSIDPEYHDEEFDLMGMFLQERDYHIPPRVLDDNWYLPSQLDGPLDALEIMGECMSDNLQDTFAMLRTLIAALQLSNLKKLKLIGKCEDGDMQLFATAYSCQLGAVSVQSMSLVELEISHEFDSSIFAIQPTLWPNLRSVKLTWGPTAGMVSSLLGHSPSELEKLELNLSNEVNWDSVLTGMEKPVDFQNGQLMTPTTADFYEGCPRSSVRTLSKLKKFIIVEASVLTDFFVYHGLLHMDNIVVVKIGGKPDLSKEAQKHLITKLGPNGSFKLIQ